MASQQKTGSFLKFFSFMNLCLMSGPLWAIEPLNDDAMRVVTGQTLFYTQYIAPSGSTTSNFGFYRLGIDAKMEINANVRSLKLGCGGSNGASGCDIDIDYLSLTGNTNTNRAASDAVITNPFLELAIKNPTSASTRELAGVRFSAAQIAGMLTTGLENSATPNGINSLSGYLKTATATGTATTAARAMTYADTGLTINGVVQGRLFGSSSGTTCNGTFFDPCYNISFSSDTYNLNLQS